MNIPNRSCEVVGDFRAALGAEFLCHFGEVIELHDFAKLLCKIWGRCVSGLCCGCCSVQYIPAVRYASSSGGGEFPAHTPVLLDGFYQFFFDGSLSHKISLFLEVCRSVKVVYKPFYVEEIFTFFLACVRSVYEVHRPALFLLHGAGGV